LRDRERGLPALNERQTVGVYLTSWIETYGQRRRLTSYRRYEHTVRLHLIPALGAIVLSKLTAHQVQTFLTQKLASGASAFKVRYCHRVLRAALTDATLLGLVHRNVASLVKPPRVRAREMKILTEEQVRQLLEAIRGERLEAMVVLALGTTMREGELLALLWEDVDLERATLLVRATLQKSPGHLVREETKTDHSRRLIALPKIAVEALRHHRIRQAAERLRLGDAWQDMGLVFPNEIG
jgi:integrase